MRRERRSPGGLSRQLSPAGCRLLLAAGGALSAGLGAGAHTLAPLSERFYWLRSYLWLGGGKGGGCTSEALSVLRFKTDCNAALILHPRFPLWNVAPQIVDFQNCVTSPPCHLTGASGFAGEVPVTP